MRGSPNWVRSVGSRVCIKLMHPAHRANTITKAIRDMTTLSRHLERHEYQDFLNHPGARQLTPRLYHLVREHLKHPDIRQVKTTLSRGLEGHT